MKQKLHKIIAIVIVTMFISGGITLQAQGLFNAEENKAEANQIEKMEPNPGLFKDFGGGGVVGPGEEPGGKDPIGGGLVILGLLSGAYALIKRNVIKKNEK